MSDNIIGQKIVAIEALSDAECEELMWDRPATVIKLENGMRIFASRDDEGNGKGTLFTEHNGATGYLFHD